MTLTKCQSLNSLLTLHKLHIQLNIFGFNFLDLLINLMKIMLLYILYCPPPPPPPCFCKDLLILGHRLSSLNITRDGYREKRSGQTYLFNIWSQEPWTETQVKVCLLRSHTLKFQPRNMSCSKKSKDDHTFYAVIRIRSTHPPAIS
jgi:hypothetical protein